MLTPIKILVLIFLHFFGGLPIIPMVRRVHLAVAVPLTRSPYVSERRRRHDQRVPRPALRHPRLSPWTQLLNSANDQALITSCGVDFDSFLTLLA